MDDTTKDSKAAQQDWNEILALLEVAKAAQGYQDLWPIRDAAMEELRAIMEELEKEAEAKAKAKAEAKAKEEAEKKAKAEEEAKAAEPKAEVVEPQPEPAHPTPPPSGGASTAAYTPPTYTPIHDRPRIDGDEDA